MKLARPLRRSPLDIAEALAEQLARRGRRAASSPTPRSPGPGSSTSASPTPRTRGWSPAILGAPGAWGRIPAVNPRRVNVEFVSANPTGPLTVGNARGAFVGDLLCRVLEAGGQEVMREYYFNDSGDADRQAGRVGGRGPPRRAGPRGRLHGAYVEQLAREVPDDVWAEATADGADTAAVLGALGVEAGAGDDRGQPRARSASGSTSGRARRRSTTRAGSSGRSSGSAQAATVYEQDGATWFRSTDYGDDKDRVIYRSDGRPTYFAADIGYVTEKFSRGFDHLIYIWGVDHHGTIARNKNAAQAMGYDPDHYQVLLIGWVKFVVDGVEVSMSKRAGTFVTLDDLLDAVGTDAARWFFASRAAHVEFDFDIEQARNQSSREPRLLRPVRPRADRVDRAQGGRGGAVTRARTSRGLLDGEPEAALARVVARGSPRSWRTRSSPRRRRASRPTRPSWPRSSTRSTATRGSWTRSSRSGPRAARAGAGDADDARERARPARDLGPRVDVAPGDRPD